MNAARHGWHTDFGDDLIAFTAEGSMEGITELEVQKCAEYFIRTSQYEPSVEDMT